MEDQSIQTVQSLPQNPPIQPVNIPEEPKISSIIIGLVAIVCLVVIGLGGFYLGKQAMDNDVLPTSNPTTSIQPTYPAITPPASVKSTYIYNAFSFLYPKDWKFISKKDNVNFPLGDRLIFSDEVIAVSKDNIYLIVMITSNSDQLESGGIFIDDKEYNEFVSIHDEVMIDESVFYLSQNHPSIANLTEAHSGPGMWGSLFEYNPSVVTGSGNVFKGYEQVISKNGYLYDFIVVGEKEEITPTSIQTDIKEMLETIKW